MAEMVVLEMVMKVEVEVDLQVVQETEEME